MMSLVTGFQNAFDSSATMSIACSSVTSVNSAAILREVKSGSKTTVSPASLATVSKITRESLVIFKLIGVRERGLSCGGPAIGLGCCSAGGAGAGAFSALLVAIAFIVFCISCWAMGLAGSIISAF